MPLGLTYHYRWDILAGKPRMVDHWTRNGEHYRFCYGMLKEFLNELAELKEHLESGKAFGVRR